MLVLRSLAFNTVFYASLIVQMIFWAPFYFLSPRHAAWFVPKFWARTCAWLYEKIADTGSEITGAENLPEGSFILAPKHQSFWDAISFFPYLDDPLYILKRELQWIPFFGWYIMKMRMIPVDRGSRSKALKAVVAATRAEMARNPRQLIIYPEGTRRAPGAEPSYKWGIVEIRKEADRVPERLMFRREDERAFRQVFRAGDLGTRIGDLLVEPGAAPRPELRHEPGDVAGRQEIEGGPEDHLDDEAGIENGVEGQGSEDEHATVRG